MNVELVAQMFKNYQSNVLFHLEGMETPEDLGKTFHIGLTYCSNGQPERTILSSLSSDGTDLSKADRPPYQ